jgi:hypothetical protein
LHRGQPRIGRWCAGPALAPALKARPSPVRTTAPTAVSFSNSMNASRNGTIDGPVGLRRSGWFSATTATLPSNLISSSG